MVRQSSRARKRGKVLRDRRKLGTFQRLGFEACEERLPLASTLPAGFQEALVASGLTQPSSMTLAPDGRIFVAEKTSGIRVIKDGAILPTRFVSLQVEQGGERGVQSVVFDPNFAQNRYVYVYYSRYTAAGSFNRLSRFQADPANPDVALPGETVLLDNIATVAPGYHNGGLLRFGADGMLYLGIGDLTGPTSVQDLSKINGKILRLNASGFNPSNPSNPSSLYPSDNPFVGTPGAVPGLYAYGLRNPFSGDMKPGTNTLYINDVGTGISEEINQLARGANYGWPTAEGPSSNPAFTNPLHQYAHEASGAGAITGGTFYTGSMFPSVYTGSYFFADYAIGFIRNFNPATGIASSFATNVNIPLDVDQATDGSLYWLSFGEGGPTGAVYHITFSSGSNQAPTAVATATSPTSGLAPLTVSFSGAGSSDPNGDALTYTWNFGDGSTGSGATISHTFVSSGNYNVLLTVNDRPGGAGLSNTSQPVSVTVGNRAPTGAISSPTANSRYRAGDVISFSGTGTDPDTGNLPDSAFSWTIDFHHNTHSHPFVGPTNGVRSGSFQIPLTGEFDPDQWYRVQLTVTDSGGLQHTSFVDVLPTVATFTLATNVSGATVNLDGQQVTTPTTFSGVIGMTRQLSAPLTQTIGGRTYNFVSWSDGGAATHNISTPSSAATYTATYTLPGVTLPAGFTQTLFVGGLNEPSAMTFMPDGRILVAEKPLGFRLVKNGVLQSTPFLTLPLDRSADRGIFGVVTDPNFSQNGYVYVYVYYTRLASGTSANRLSRFTVTTGADVASPASETVLIDSIPVGTPGYLNGGLMRFGADGKLYLGIGDMMNPAAAQDLSQLNGKLLRLNATTYNPANPSSLIPSDNPFVATAGARPEIWAYGLRNPFSGDIRPGTNTLYVNDTGAGFEEIEVAARGANYGWPTTEGGASTNPAFTKPLFSYPHGTGAAIAGGTYFAGANFPSQYAGTYFFGDYVAGLVQNLNLTTGQATAFASNVDSPVGLAQAPDGSLYVLSHGASGGAFGAINRIAYTAAPVNRPPVASGDSASTIQDTPITIGVLNNDSDPDGDALSIAAVTQGAHGSITINPDGTLRYNPAANYLGSDNFQYTVSDGRGGTATATVTVSIGGLFLISTTSGGTLASTNGTANLNFTDADIVQLSVQANGQYGYQLYFDGSDVGLTSSNEDMDAFTLLADGSIVISTSGGFSVPAATGGNLSGNDEDLLRFVPTSLGTTTAGAWSMYFDGGDVGLSSSSENIDAVAVLSDGRIVISTSGGVSASNVSGQGEDLLAFQPTTLGAATTGTWSIYFDGSDVGLSSSETIDALDVRENGTGTPKLFFSTTSTFSVSGVSGNNEDGVAFTSSTLGSATSGSYGPGLTFDGSLYGLSSYNLDGIRVGPPVLSGSSALTLNSRSTDAAIAASIVGVATPSEKPARIKTSDIGSRVSHTTSAHRAPLTASSENHSDAADHHASSKRTKPTKTAAARRIADAALKLVRDFVVGS